MKPQSGTIKEVTNQFIIQIQERKSQVGNLPSSVGHYVENIKFTANLGDIASQFISESG